MKTTTTIVYLVLTLTISTQAQQVNGLICADTAGVMVIKVWGDHQERGYALGYLTGDRITDVIVHYIKPSFGAYYSILDIANLLTLNLGIHCSAMMSWNDATAGTKLAGAYLIKLGTQGGETVGKIMIGPF